MSYPSSFSGMKALPDQDDDFVAGLVEQMAHSTLDEEEGQDGEQWPEQDESPSAAAAAASAAAAAGTTTSSCSLWPPLHDLSAQGKRSGWNSSRSSPSPAVSPPTPLHHFGHESKSPTGDAWELLHLAAKEVMRLKAAATCSSSPPSPSYSRDEILAFNRAQAMYHPLKTGSSVDSNPVASSFGQQQQQVDWKQQQRSTPRHHSCYQNPSTPGAWNRRSRSLQQQQQQHQQQQQQRQQQQLASIRNLPHSASSTRSSNIYHSSSSSQQWPAAATSNTHHGSGMRAVFLRGPGFASSTSNGTGVFLPQATASMNNNRDHKHRKPTCSTVLLPSRIVEVLNLNVDELNCQPPPAATSNDLPGGDEYLTSHLSKSYSACSPTRWHSTAELALPTEWTY